MRWRCFFDERRVYLWDEPLRALALVPDDRLCLADVNPQAVAACRKTIEANGLHDRVTLYESDCLDAIPDGERWDLVVGNPPHSGTAQIIDGWSPNTLTYMDPDWSLHRRFYRDVGKHLNPGGVVLIQENNQLSKVGDFAPMIETNGLRIVYVSAPPPPFINEPIYYIGSVRAEEWSAGIGIGIGIAFG
jgi:methylase of polypeptide subunit release factors